MEKERDKNSNRNKNEALAGYFAVIAGTLALTFYDICFKRVLFSNTFLTPFQAVIIRCVVQLVMISSIMVVQKVKPFVNDFKISITLLGLSTARVIQAVLGVTALIHVSVGTSNILFAMLPLFTIFFSRLLLDKSGPTLTFTILAIFCFLGAVCVAYPSIIRKAIPGVRSDNDTGWGYAKGIICVASSAIFDAIYLIFGKIVSSKVDYKLTVFYKSIFGVVILPIVMWIFGLKFYLQEISDLDWAALLFGSISMFFNVFLTAFAFPRVPPGPMAMMFLLDVTWGYIYDIFIRHLQFYPISIIGIIVIVITCILTICVEVYKWDLSFQNIFNKFKTIFRHKDKT